MKNEKARSSDTQPHVGPWADYIIVIVFCFLSFIDMFHFSEHLEISHFFFTELTQVF